LETISQEDRALVPTVYQQNQELTSSIEKLRQDVSIYKEIAQKARSTFDKLRKERDFHRMHHKRVSQEKQKLIQDLKKLKKHYGDYDPTLKQLQAKYEAALKEKMMAKIERDKYLLKVSLLEDTVKNLEKLKDISPSILDINGRE
jgi:sperm-associated antigen 16 protein